MSLHELKEEKERQDRLADEAWAEVSLAQEEIQAAQMRMNAAKVKHSEAVCMGTILSDKSAEMEDARDSVLEDDERVDSVVRTTRKRGSGAQPYPARRTQPFGRVVVGQLHCRQCNKPQPPCHSPATPCVHCQWEPSN